LTNTDVSFWTIEVCTFLSLEDMNSFRRTCRTLISVLKPRRIDISEYLQRRRAIFLGSDMAQERPFQVLHQLNADNLSDLVGRDRRIQSVLITGRWKCARPVRQPWHNAKPRDLKLYVQEQRRRHKGLQEEGRWTLARTKSAPPRANFVPFQISFALAKGVPERMIHYEYSMWCTVGRGRRSIEVQELSLYLVVLG